MDLVLILMVLELTVLMAFLLRLLLFSHSCRYNLDEACDSQSTTRGHETSQDLVLRCVLVPVLPF